MDNYYKNCPARMNDARFLTDYRTANTREQNIKMINGFVNDDEYRLFLQQNASKVMDNSWDVIKNKNMCRTNSCIHTNPTRTTNLLSYRELNKYNAVRTGLLQSNDAAYPNCQQYADYRSSFTDGSDN